MGVDRQAREVHGHAAHDVGRLATHAWHRDEVPHRGRHLTPEALDQRVGHADEALGLVPVEAGRADDVLHLQRRGDGQRLRAWGTGRTGGASPCSRARRCTAPRGSWRPAARRGCGARARRARALPGTRAASRSWVRRARPRRCADDARAGSSGFRHPAARVHTGTVAAMRHLEIDRAGGRARLERVPPGGSSTSRAWPTRMPPPTCSAPRWTPSRPRAAGWPATGCVPATPRPPRPAGGSGWSRSGGCCQLRRPLPVDAPWDLDVRPFVVGDDEDAWLAVNNRAFAWHPEQGGWTRAELGTAWPSRGSIPPGSCSTRSTAGWSGSAGPRPIARSARRWARST